ncbi:S-adenosyl-L-methionine-dependent methyltransferase [Aspergillus pseudoustus]|uniref:S-adenosyl-L-methionine-dependent methyltransferase n=1 Tax=Aspergillus pseudoustus TaxID=1810923 RepID=A0ABR4KH97_9EURO
MSAESKVAEASATIEQLLTLDVSDRKTHAEIVEKCRAVISALQDPAAVVVETLASVTTHPSLVALSNLGIFEKLAAANEPLTGAQLAERTGGDQALIVRLLRIAAASGIVTETGPQTFAATGASRMLAIPSFAAGLRLNHRTAELANSLPAYLAQTENRNITSYTNGLFQYHYKTDQGSFEYRASDEAWMTDFNLFMTVPNNTGNSWPETFDARGKIFAGGAVKINADTPLVVDVAGGMGQDLRRLKEYLPLGSFTKGQLILQDQAHVIESVPADMHDDAFTYVPHNFFGPQPAAYRGARVYTLKSVLHDWADEKAVEILRHIADSLTPGYSKLWILDRIVPETGADKALAWLDISMMAIYGALERTQEQWAGLLQKVGLRIVSVQATPDHFGLIEAELETAVLN